MAADIHLDHQATRMIDAVQRHPAGAIGIQIKGGQQIALAIEHPHLAGDGMLAI